MTSLQLLNIYWEKKCFAANYFVIPYLRKLDSVSSMYVYFSKVFICNKSILYVQNETTQFICVPYNSPSPQSNIFYSGVANTSAVSIQCVSDKNVQCYGHQLPYWKIYYYSIGINLLRVNTKWTPKQQQRIRMWLKNYKVSIVFYRHLSKKIQWTPKTSKVKIVLD